jgi:hypothetical protein
VFFMRRSRGGPDPFLTHKMVAFAAGAVLALAGIALDVGWLVTAAILVLVATMIITRIAAARRPPAPPE